MSCRVCALLFSQLPAPALPSAAPPPLWLALAADAAFRAAPPARLPRPQRPVPWSSILQFAVGYSLCPATQRLLGPRRYARVRQVPVTVARLLTMSGSLGVQIGLGPLPLDRFWTGFLWRLLLATLCITQVHFPAPEARAPGAAACPPATCSPRARR